MWLSARQRNTIYDARISQGRKFANHRFYTRAMAHSLALQWSLDHTADRFLRVGRNLIYAATIDNVQPLAIMACERFGATLAICPMTQLKVEKLIKSQTSSVAVAFLKATAGFANGGTIMELSKSMAGINFLALAASLVSVATTFNAATAIQMMITDSAADKTLVPTAYHLKDLLDVLEPQLNRVGFLTDVLAWKDWWTRHASLSPDAQENLRTFGGTVPASEGIVNIVTALREVSRVGEAEARTVNITIGDAAPWLTAFVKWCLGEPPTICTADGQWLLDQPLHPVKIIYTTEVTTVSSTGVTTLHEVRIDILSAFDKFNKIITSAGRGNDHFAAGMMDIPSHAKHVLSATSMDNDLRYFALVQALPFALRYVRNNYYTQRDSLSTSSRGNVKKSNIFPSETVIANVMKRYLSLTNGVKLQSFPPGSLITDLPELRAYVEGKDETSAANEMEYLVKQISLIAADILVLSLFDGYLDSLVVYHDSGDDSRSRHGFAKNINGLLHNTHEKNNVKSLLEIVLAWALQLVEHDVTQQLRTKEWVCSSSHGQVVYPKVFDRPAFQANGSLELRALPGVLTLPGKGAKTFSLVKSILDFEKNFKVEDWESSLKYKGPIARSLNLYPGQQLLWRVSELGDYLALGMGWSMNSRCVPPFYLLENMSRAVFTDACSHAEPDTFDAGSRFQLRNPAAEIFKFSTWEADPKGHVVETYAVAGNHGLRMLALTTVFLRTSLVSAVISNDTCLECLHKQCMLSERPVAIL